MCGRFASETRTRSGACERKIAPTAAETERVDPRLHDAWPQETKAERARFGKLKDAYVKARYSKHYRNTEEELAGLGERVSGLAGTVETVCRERIAQLAGTARNAG